MSASPPHYNPSFFEHIGHQAASAIHGDEEELNVTCVITAYKILILQISACAM